MDYYYLCKHILTKLWDNLSPHFPCHLTISSRSIASCWDSLNSTHIMLTVDLQMCLACTDGRPPGCKSNSGCLNMARSVLPHLENQPTHAFHCFRCLLTVLFCRYSSCSSPGCCMHGCVCKLSCRTSETPPSPHPCTQVPLLITLLPALDKVKLST